MGILGGYLFEKIKIPKLIFYIIAKEQMMGVWNPWRGCKKCSEGCLHCYIHKGDLKRGINTNNIIKTDDFYKPIIKQKMVNIK